MQDGKTKRPDRQAVEQAQLEAAALAKRTDPHDAELAPDSIGGIRVHPFSYMRVQILHGVAEALNVDEATEEGQETMAYLGAFGVTCARGTLKALRRNPAKLLERAEEWADEVPADAFCQIVDYANRELERVQAASQISSPDTGAAEEPEGNETTPTGSDSD